MEDASKADRSRASAVVEAAFASGRIIAADRDLRLGQIRSARTRQDVDLVIRDLPGGLASVAVPASPEAPSAPPVPPVPAVSTGLQQPWPLPGSPSPQPGYGVEYGPSDDGASAAQISGVAAKVGGAIAVAVFLTVGIAVVGVVIAVFSAAGDFTEGPFAEPVDETTYSPGVMPGPDGVNVLTTRGMTDLVSAIEDRTGSTEVFSAVLYPRYAVVSLPVGATGKRYVSHRWDGEALTRTPIKSTSTNPRIDLADLDAEVLLRLLEDNLSRMDDADTWYAVVDSWTDGPRISVYASNDFGETVYLLADLDGEVRFESTS
jgi:hypothetical protein